MKHFLVIGGAGALGTPLVRALAAAGHKVRIFDDLSRGTVKGLEDLRDDIEFINGDVRDRVFVFEAMKSRSGENKIDAVIHLAAINGTANFYAKPGEVLSVGVKGIMNVMEGCARAGVRELFVASSSEVYQEPALIPTPEEVPLVVPDVHNSRYSYGGSKILTELFALHYAQEAFDRIVVFRPHNVFGPSMKPDHVIPAFIERLRFLSSQQPEGTIRFPIEGDGTETRAFCYIDDAVDQIMLLLEKGEHRQIYNVGSETTRSIEELANTIAKHWGRKILFDRGPRKPGGARWRCPDLTKIRKLGWEEQVGFDSGIFRTVQWYKQQEKTND